MPDTNNSNKLKTSEILTLAYKHLWDGDFHPDECKHSRNVCRAVGAAFRELNIDNLSDADGWHPYRASKDRFHDYMDLILKETDTAFYSKHLNKLGVPINLIHNPEWMQLRRRELLCSIISYFESIND